MSVRMHVDNGAMRAEALWYVASGRAELRQESVSVPKDGEILVRAIFGALSRGTERLVHSGRVPASEYARMRAPRMGGAFPFPVKYGYAVVGRVEGGSADLLNRIVFVLHPHQTLFTVPGDTACVVPEHVPAQRAVLAANMETALNAMWDAAPGPADRIAVVGGGLIGLLVARLCAGLPGAQVTVVDIAPSRRELAWTMGARFAAPGDAPGDCDVVFHVSGTAAGLATALRLAGDEASIVELSWYGAGDVPVPLGEAFHSRRLRLVSSQVGQVASSRRPRWSTRRRLAAAVALLSDPALDQLIAPAISFRDLPAGLASVLDPQSDVVCQLIRYSS